MNTAQGKSVYAIWPCVEIYAFLLLNYSAYVYMKWLIFQLFITLRMSS